MTTTHPIRASLIAGHAALATLALGAMQVATPVAPMPQWHQAGPISLTLAEAPRRLPTSRRAERAIPD